MLLKRTFVSTIRLQWVDRNRFYWETRSRPWHCCPLEKSSSKRSQSRFRRGRLPTFANQLINPMRFWSCRLRKMLDPRASPSVIMRGRVCKSWRRNDWHFSTSDCRKCPPCDSLLLRPVHPRVKRSKLPPICLSYDYQSETNWTMTNGWKSEICSLFANNNVLYQRETNLKYRSEICTS